MKDLFSVSSKEQRGMIILLILLLLTIVAGLTMPLMVREEVYDIQAFQAEIDTFLASLEKTGPEKDTLPQTKYSPSQKQYAKPYVEKYQKKTDVSVTPAITLIELNSADSAGLLGLTGIGPYYAGKIIRYRERLGGFISKEQLLEIRGMDSLRLAQFEKQVTIDRSLVRTIDLNTVSFKELLKHPYFEYYLVKEIFKFRDEHERIDSVKQLLQIPVIYEELYLKICGYLEVR